MEKSSGEKVSFANCLKGGTGGSRWGDESNGGVGTAQKEKDSGHRPQVREL